MHVEHRKGWCEYLGRFMLSVCSVWLASTKQNGGWQNNCVTSVIVWCHVRDLEVNGICVLSSCLPLLLSKLMYFPQVPTSKQWRFGLFAFSISPSSRAFPAVVWIAALDSCFSWWRNNVSQTFEITTLPLSYLALNKTKLILWENNGLGRSYRHSEVCCVLDAARWNSLCFPCESRRLK